MNCNRFLTRPHIRMAGGVWVVDYFPNRVNPELLKAAACYVGKLSIEKHNLNARRIRQAILNGSFINTRALISELRKCDADFQQVQKLIEMKGA